MIKLLLSARCTFGFRMISCHLPGCWYVSFICGSASRHERRERICAAGLAIWREALGRRGELEGVAGAWLVSECVMFGLVCCGFE